MREDTFNSGIVPTERIDVTNRLRVGVVGCGVIAQVMHLPHLAELRDRYEIAALCDNSEPTARACAEMYGVENVFTS